MFKTSTLLRVLFTVAISTSSFAASAANYTINFDNIAAGANANTDLVAQANGVSFASGHLVDTLNANFDVIGQHWAAYSLVADGTDPAIFAQNSSSFTGAGTSNNALDAQLDQVMVQFSNPTQLSSFSFNLDNTGYGNLQAANVLFLDAQGNTVLTSADFFQASTTSFTQSFASALTVSAVLLTSGKYYDNLSISVAAVPEPETYAMLLGGLGLMGFMVRRRMNKQA